MDVSATISVKPADGEKPDRTKLEEAARLLKESGFEVTRIGRYGVSVPGEQTTSPACSALTRRPTRRWRCQAKPAQRELDDLIDRSRWRQSLSCTEVLVVFAGKLT